MTIIMQALRAARRMIETERNWFLDNLAIPDERGILHPDDKETLKDYDDVLALVRDAIDAAMKEESGEQSTSSFENFMEIPYGAR